MGFWKFMAFTQAACQSSVLAVVWIATGHLNLITLALGIASLLAGLCLVDLDRERKHKMIDYPVFGGSHHGERRGYIKNNQMGLPSTDGSSYETYYFSYAAGAWYLTGTQPTDYPSKTLGVNSTHTTSATTIAASVSASSQPDPAAANHRAWLNGYLFPGVAVAATDMLVGQTVTDYLSIYPNQIQAGPQSTQQTVPNLPGGQPPNNVYGQAAYTAQQLDQQLGVMLVADPDPLLAIKQSVGCTHTVTHYRAKDYFTWRFLHEGDSFDLNDFDLLPQYNPVPEVTAWLTSVCRPDNLELWLIGVPQVTPCEPDWSES